MGALQTSLCGFGKASYQGSREGLPKRPAQPCANRAQLLWSTGGAGSGAARQAGRAPGDVQRQGLAELTSIRDGPTHYTRGCDGTLAFQGYQEVTRSCYITLNVYGFTICEWGIIASCFDSTSLKKRNTSTAVLTL